MTTRIYLQQLSSFWDRNKRLKLKFFVLCICVITFSMFPLLFFLCSTATSAVYVCFFVYARGCVCLFDSSLSHLLTYLFLEHRPRKARVLCYKNRIVSIFFLWENDNNFRRDFLAVYDWWRHLQFFCRFVWILQVIDDWGDEWWPLASINCYFFFCMHYFKMWHT